MRRSLSALLLGLSLVVASMGWAGFTLTRTALDPGRSEELADQVFENPDLRGALVSVLADRIELILPAGVVLPRPLLVQIADRALDDPAIKELVHEGLVEVHQKALRGDDSDTTLHATAVGTAARRALVAERPELDAVVPQAPAMRIELPTAGLSVLGRVRSGIESASMLAAFAAAIGAIVALLAARDRGLVLRRVANWAFGTAAFWLLAAIVLPLVVSELAPRQGIVAGAIASVMFGAMVKPATLLALSGVALLVCGWIWSQGSRRRGAHMVGTPRLINS